MRLNIRTCDGEDEAHAIDYTSRHDEPISFSSPDSSVNEVNILKWRDETKVAGL